MFMRRSWGWLVVAGLGAASVGCDDSLGPERPDEQPVRLVLVHRQGTGDNMLLRTDGSPPTAFDGATAGLVPVGVAPREQVVALLRSGAGGVLVLSSIQNPGRLDTIIDPIPTSMSLVSFSQDERYVALVSYAPVQAVLIFDRANRTIDTLPYGNADPVLPPMLSPDNRRVALITVTPLSMFLTILYPGDPARSDTDVLGFSRLLNRPIFGWPRWTADGLLMAFVRVGVDAPDTLVIGTGDPDTPDFFFTERSRAVMAPVSDARPEVRIGAESTYAFSADGRALVLGADPGTGIGRHAIYLVTPEVGRVQLLLDDPAQFPVFPLFIG